MIEPGPAVVVPSGTPVPPADERIHSLPHMHVIGREGTHAVVFETNATEAYTRCACRDCGVQVVSITKVRPGVIRVKVLETEGARG